MKIKETLKEKLKLTHDWFIKWILKTVTALMFQLQFEENSVEIQFQGGTQQQVEWKDFENAFSLKTS